MRFPDLSQLPDLPVRAALGAVTDALAAHGSAVLVAPPGTGKTTLVPLALAAAHDAEGSRVLVAEPRRLATRAAAARMAVLLGEPVGETVGYAVRGDARRSERTRIEVVTSGLLLRRLMADPELVGVHTVLLDECHERHLDADLLLALLLDARAGLRPDLRLLAASATVATDRLTALLGGAPVLRVEARMFPVTIRHVPPARGERVETCVARAVRQALREGTETGTETGGGTGGGDVLAFLPGVPEIRRTATLLAGADLAGVDVLQLHGRLPAAEQDAALTPGPRRRVVLSTAVAESSLTVPGVRAVVDAGLARTPRTDHRRGLAGLVTVRVSAAVAEQRAGRAGREAPGRVYRCWPEGELLARYPEPEIRTADLTRLALDLACWGTPDGSALSWWDPPPTGPLQAGQQVLRSLGALDDAGVTERGRRLSELGLHPRLARALLDGTAMVGARTAAEVVALIDDDTLAEGVAVDDELRRLRAGTGRGAGRWRVEVSRLRRLLPRASGAAGPRSPAEGVAALVVALAYPERLARRRPEGAGPQRLSREVYLLSRGTAVELPAGSPLAGQEWLAVAVADRTPGAEHGRIRLAAAADRELAELAAPALLVDEDEVRWLDGDVVARRVRRLGAIVLTERRLDQPDPDAVERALRHGLHAEGLGLLRWTEHARRLRDRLATLHRVFGDEWPDVSDAALLADPDRWWVPALARARSRADLARIDAATVLRALLDHRRAARLDELAPERIEVPSGSRIAVDYSADQPVLAVKIQQVFGWTGTPTVAGGRLPVVLHLLSPAGRPAAVTADLTSFWATGYRQVRAELRGRYPKHAWPEDPLQAPTRPPRRSG
ncbi:MAG TPA: ATP-dependent helicase HrpB [Pseudonocardia sp.]